MAQKIRLDLEVRDDGSAALKRFGNNAQRSFKKVGRSADKMNNSLAKSAARITALVGGAALLKKLSSSFLDAAKQTENFKIRLEVLLGSVEEGNRLFNLMTQYASQVPFTFQDIMASATMLAGVVKGGVNEISKWIPLIGDLAAATGFNIREATEQVMRMLSAGAQSAERFKERGILAFLGFQQGVSYTAEQTAQILWNAWNKTGSRFKGATDKMRDTWDGLMSMMSDQWDRIMRNIADTGIYDALKDSIRVIVELLGGAAKESDDTADSFERIADAIRTVNNLVRENKDLLFKLVDVLAIIGVVFIGGVILKALKAVVGVIRGLIVLLGFGKTFFVSMAKELKLMHKGALSLALVLKNWKEILKFTWTRFKLIRIAVGGIVGLIAFELIGALWESYRILGDISGVWDVLFRKLKTGFEGIRHFITKYLLSIPNIWVKIVNAMLDYWEWAINQMLDVMGKTLRKFLGLPDKIQLGRLEGFKFTNKLIEKEHKRHMAVLKQIEEDFMGTRTGKFKAVREFARSFVAGVRGEEPTEGGGGAGGGEVKKDTFMADLKEKLRRQDLERLQKAMEEEERYIKQGLEDLHKIRVDAWNKDAAERDRVDKAVFKAEMLALAWRQEQNRKAAEEIARIWRQAFDIGIGGVTDALVESIDNWIDRTKQLKQIWGEALRSMGLDLIRLAIRIMFVKALTHFGVPGFKEGGIVGFQHGGVVKGPQSGYPAILHGEEAVIPLKGGKVPVDIGGAGTGMTIINNVTVQSAAGQSAGEADRQGKIAGRAIEAEIKRVIMETRRPGGILNRGVA